MLDALISDLEPGDEFRPVRYQLTEFMAQEYAHGTEQDPDDFLIEIDGELRQARMPTAVHSDKMRLLEENTEEKRLGGGYAKDARVHYEYEAQHHSPAFVGEEIVLTGRITDKYERKGRHYLAYQIEVKTADGRPVTTYHDRTLLRYREDEK
jgi:hypothetical protein